VARSPYAELREKYECCVVCGSTDGLQAHHVVFRSQGGKEEDNLVLICRRCHAKRHEELIDIQIDGDEVVVLDRETGEITRRSLVPHRATRPSKILDYAYAVSNWLDVMLFGDLLRAEPDEVLVQLFYKLREVGDKCWRAAAAIVAEIQRRASYGDSAVEQAARKIGISRCNAYFLAQIHNTLLTNPECAAAADVLQEQGWYKAALRTSDPVEAINYAAQRKLEDPSYTIKKFEREIKDRSRRVTITRAVLYCQEFTPEDRALAARVGAFLGVRVELLPDPHAAPSN
jgi:hypothetical protein